MRELELLDTLNVLTDLSLFVHLKCSLGEYVALISLEVLLLLVLLRGHLILALLILDRVCNLVLLILQEIASCHIHSSIAIGALPSIPFEDSNSFQTNHVTFLVSSLEWLGWVF